jgi:hypothetical protein
MAVEDAAVEEVVVVVLGAVVVVRVVVSIREAVAVVVVGEGAGEVDGREEEEEEEKVAGVVLLSSATDVVATRHDRLVEAAVGVVVFTLEGVVGVEEGADAKVVAMYHFARVLRASEDVVAVEVGAVLVLVVDAGATYHTIASAGEESAAKHNTRRERRRAAMTGRGEAGRDQEVVRWLRLAGDAMGALVRERSSNKQQLRRTFSDFDVPRVVDEKCRRGQTTHRFRLVQRVHSRQRRFSNASAVERGEERIAFSPASVERRDLELPTPLPSPSCSLWHRVWMTF